MPLKALIDCTNKVQYFILYQNFMKCHALSTLIVMFQTAQEDELIERSL